MSQPVPESNEGFATVRVLVVEDHTLVRHSIVKTVAAEPDFNVVGEAGRGEEALALAKSLRPDLVLLDISIPDEDGIQIAGRIKDILPQTAIVFVTMYDDDATIRRALAAGADGYVPKTATANELLQGLRAVVAGGSYLSPSIARRVMTLANQRSGGSPDRLTDRELEMLQLLAGGARPAEVAERMFLSVKTVKNYLSTIYAKLGVSGAAQAVAEAYQRGLVLPPRVTARPR